jgi:hypothetical protein
VEPPTADFAALERAADAVALLTADRLAAGKLGRFARAVLAPPGSPGVRALRDPGTSHDAANPVRAAAALLSVDDVAAHNLAQLIKHAIPEPRAATDSGNVDDQLSVTDQLLEALALDCETLY